MTNQILFRTNNSMARQAGLFYLGVVLTGIFSLMYVPSQLIVWNDAATTFKNISASETLFRWGIVSSMACYVFFIFLPLSLFRLLESISRWNAYLMVVLSIVSVPISFINLSHKFSILTLLHPELPSTLTQEQVQEQVMFHLNAYNDGILIASVFWGLWLFPFGYLVFKSGILPKVLGVLLMVGCFGYLINILANVVNPAYTELGIAGWVRLPASLGEIGTCLWLLMMGAKEYTAAQK
ncbi:MAG: DUF4386 domain-containing protein [Cyclobacteriaceae bacterium]|nr:DUF4386 domain-containing protein [Cyclobacteriaceae bacterium]